jgi:allantoicase
LIPVASQENWTHVKLHIYPDGGVARLKVYGRPQIDRSRYLNGEPWDAAALKNGGRALLCSDMFFGQMENLLLPGRGTDMGDGWETRRRRGPGHDWVIVELADSIAIKRVKIDTAHFKGNYPDRFSLEACEHRGEMKDSAAMTWKEIIHETKLRPNCEHFFTQEILDQSTHFSHVRLNIYPDGGVSRLNVFGFGKNI